MSAAAPPRLPQGKLVWGSQNEPTPFRLARMFCRIVCSTLFDLKVYGIDAFPRTGGVLVVSNHQSMLDPVLLGVGIPRSMSYMARSGLFTNPLFGGLIRSMGAFPVRQSGSAAGAIKETIERLQAGRALNIFPEGGRTPHGGIMPFEKGTALVIRKAKVPVVPAAIHGAFEAFPPGTTSIKPHPIRVMFGQPLVLHDRKPDEITATLEADVRRMYDELQAADPAAEQRRAWTLHRIRSLRSERRRRNDDRAAD